MRKLLLLRLFLWSSGQRKDLDSASLCAETFLELLVLRLSAFHMGKGAVNRITFTNQDGGLRL